MGDLKQFRVEGLDISNVLKSRNVLQLKLELSQKELELSEIKAKNFELRQRNLDRGQMERVADAVEMGFTEPLLHELVAAGRVDAAVDYVLRPMACMRFGEDGL